MIKKQKLLGLGIFVALSCASLSGCSFIKIKPKTYEVRWANYYAGNAEHKVYLDVETYEAGEIPSFKGRTPERAADEYHTYTFKGWAPEIEAVYRDIEYMAVYDVLDITFTVKWLNYDGSLIKEEQVKKGEMPAYEGETPVKPGNERYSYVFTGWDNEYVAVYVNQTYKAQFQEVVNKYVVTFKDDDGTVLQQEEYRYGERPSYKGETLTKAGTGNLRYYNFTGWDQQIETVTKDVTYTATYETYENNVDLFKFEENNDGYTVTGLKNDALFKQIIDLNIPSSYLNKPVNKIGRLAFADSAGGLFDTITIPNSISLIDDYAFEYCSKVTSLSIPSSVTSIGKCAFKEMSALEELYIPDSITSLGQGIIENSNALKKISVPYMGSDLETPGNLNYLFSSSNRTTARVPTSLKEVIIGDTCTSIGDNPFTTNNGFFVEKVYLPRSLASCSGNINVQNIYYKGNINEWCSISFGSSNNIDNLYVFNSNNYELVETADLSAAPKMGKYALSGIGSLQNVALSTVTTKVEQYFLYRTSNISSLTIPSNILSIENSAFYGMSGLNNVTFSEGLLSIGTYAFAENTNLGNFVLPNSLTTIELSAFSGCTKLTSVNVPDNVTSLGSSVFAQCSKLETAYISNQVTSLEYTFKNCSALVSVTANGATTFNGSFTGCTNLISVNLANANSLDGTLFSDSPLIEEINVDNETYVSEDGVVYSKDKTTLVLFPRGKGGDIVLPNTLTAIGDNAFLNCNKVTRIVVPEGVVTFGDNAFSGCTSLAAINIPSSLATIGSYCFKSCTSLTELVVPSTVTRMKANAFNGSKFNKITLPFIGETAIANNTMSYIFGTVPITLQEVVVSEGCTSIAQNAFKGCSSIKKITIPDSVTSIAFGAFKECTHLNELTVPFVGENKDSTNTFGYIFGASSPSECPSNVPSSLKVVHISDAATQIPEEAFYYCNYICEVTIGNNVTSVGDSAFLNCYNITYVEVGEKVASIGNSAFMNCFKLVHVYNKSSLGITATANSSSFGYIGAYAKGVYKTTTNYLTLNDDGFYLYHYYEGNSWKYYIVNYVGNLTSITMPVMGSTEMIIDGFAFYKNTSIQSVNTNTTKIIGQSAFDSCTSLKTVTIGAQTREISNRAFAECRNLATLNFSGTTNTWLNVTKASSWNRNIKATFVTCSNGTVNL